MSPIPSRPEPQHAPCRTIWKVLGQRPTTRLSTRSTTPGRLIRSDSGHGLPLELVGLPAAHRRRGRELSGLAAHPGCNGRSASPGRLADRPCQRRPGRRPAHRAQPLAGWPPPGSSFFITSRSSYSFVWYFVLPELLPQRLGDAWTKQSDPLVQRFLAAMVCLGLFSQRPRRRAGAGRHRLPAAGRRTPAWRWA